MIYDKEKAYKKFLEENPTWKSARQNRKSVYTKANKLYYKKKNAIKKQRRDLFKKEKLEYILELHKTLSYSEIGKIFRMTKQSIHRFVEVNKKTPQTEPYQ